jgi:hypothetical protein
MDVEPAPRQRGTNMDNSQQRHPSQLFTVRLWQEDLGDGQTE